MSGVSSPLAFMILNCAPARGCFVTESYFSTMRPPLPGFTAHHETLAYQMPELGPGAQSVGDHVLRTRCRLIPGCRMSRQAGRHSHLRCAYRPARRDPRWPRDSALRLRPFHRTSSCLCRISLTQDFTPGRRKTGGVRSSSSHTLLASPARGLPCAESRILR